MPGVFESILNTLDADPRKWAARMGNVGGGSAATPPILPTSMPSATPTPSETPTTGTLTPGAGLTPSTLDVPNRNDPKYEALQPHGLKRFGLTLGAAPGGPFAPFAENALNAPEIAYERDLQAAKNAKELAPPFHEPLHVTPGEMVQQPDGTFKQVGEPKQPAPRDPLHVPPGEMVEQPDGSFKQVGTPKPPAENEEDKAVSDHLAAKGLPDTPANRDQARKDLKAADRPPQEPTAEDKAISDHLAAQGLQNTPANRDKARIDLTTSKATATADAKSEETKAQLREDANENFSKMNALAKLNTPASNNQFLMNYIAATYSGIKGARLNKAEIDRAIATRSLPDQLQRTYDLFVDKKILTPQQKKDMLESVRTVLGTYSAPVSGGKGNGGDPLGIR